jgi:hypothetical protein
MNEQKSLLFKVFEVVEQHCAGRRAARLQSAPSQQPNRVRRILRWLTPNGGTLLLIVVLLLTQNVWARQLATPAAPGPSATTVNYQGRLADPAGNPKDGVFGMTFALYDAPTGGSLVWGPENHTAVPVSEGLFSVGLGGQTSGGIPTSAWNGDRYLEITVGGETLSPRELIRSVPIAGMALTVPDGAITQNQSPFAPIVYRQPEGGSVGAVTRPVIYSGWFHGSDEGYATYDLSSIFSQIDAVIVTRTRTSGGTSSPVTFMVTDAAGTGRPTPSEIKIWAYSSAGTLQSWVQAYVVVIGR